MKLLKPYVAFEVPHKIVKQLKLVLCIGDALYAYCCEELKIGIEMTIIKWIEWIDHNYMNNLINKY
jgi:hypothetical protein